MSGRRGPGRRQLHLGLVAGVIAATALVHGAMDTQASAGRGEIFVPEPVQARLFSLGFDPLIADFYWVQALQVVGGSDGPVEAHAELIGDLIEVVTELDPWVDHPYRFAAVWLGDSIASVRRANALLEKAISYHPTDWRNRFYLGYNEFFYLEDNARAAEILETAIPMPGSPRYLGAFVTRLRAEGGRLDTAALFLEELIRNTTDEYARAGYLKAFDEIETERRARYLDSARVEFWKRHGRDIREPAELWQGELRVIEAMPPAHPHFQGFEWVLDAETGEIISSFYKSRYELHIHPTDEKRREQWRSQL